MWQFRQAEGGVSAAYGGGKPNQLRPCHILVLLLTKAPLPPSPLTPPHDVQEIQRVGRREGAHGPHLLHRRHRPRLLPGRWPMVGTSGGTSGSVSLTRRGRGKLRARRLCVRGGQHRARRRRAVPAAVPMPSNLARHAQLARHGTPLRPYPTLAIPVLTEVAGEQLSHSICVFYELANVVRVHLGRVRVTVTVTDTRKGRGRGRWRAPSRRPPFHP